MDGKQKDFSGEMFNIYASYRDKNNVCVFTES